MRDQTHWDQRVPLLAAYHFGQSRALLSEIEWLVAEALNDPVLKREMISRLVKLLDSDATPDCLRFVCRQLALIGGKESVAALAQRLGDGEIADAVVQALQIIPHSSAATTLREGLSAGESTQRIRLINALGGRRDPLAVRPLSRLLADPDEAVARASARALGKIGSRFGTEPLLAAWDRRAPEARAAFGHAALECADTLLADGRNPEALEVFSRLATAEGPEGIRAAAERGLRRIEARAGNRQSGPGTG